MPGVIRRALGEFPAPIFVEHSARLVGSFLLGHSNLSPFRLIGSGICVMMKSLRSPFRPPAENDRTVLAPKLVPGGLRVAPSLPATDEGRTMRETALCTAQHHLAEQGQMPRPVLLHPEEICVSLDRVLLADSEGRVRRRLSCFCFCSFSLSFPFGISLFIA